MSETPVKTIGHRLYAQALEEDRQQRRRQQQQRGRAKSRLISTTMTTKKTRLTDAQIDCLFDEKRHRENLIREDLLALYHQCSTRIRSMLDQNEIDRFIADIQSRLSHSAN